MGQTCLILYRIIKGPVLRSLDLGVVLLSTLQKVVELNRKEAVCPVKLSNNCIIWGEEEKDTDTFTAP